MTESPGCTASVHALRATLQDVRPAVWRRLAVPSAITLAELHQVVQMAFDWDDSHLHAFEIRGVTYAPERDDFHVPMLSVGDERDEAQATLAKVAPRPGDVLDYTYDFGDDWRHRLVVEAVGRACPDDQYPACLEGAGQAPEEDTGRVRPGRFDQQTRERLNDYLRGAGAVDGRDLPVDENPADPHFAGLFPALDIDVVGTCPCGCGRTANEAMAAVLPMLDPVPEDELAGFAARSPLVRRAVDLATWLGTGRPVTPSRLLRPADAVRAVAELGLSARPPSDPDGDVVSFTRDRADDGSAGRRRAVRKRGGGAQQQVIHLFGDGDLSGTGGEVSGAGGEVSGAGGEVSGAGGEVSGEGGPVSDANGVPVLADGVAAGADGVPMDENGREPARGGASGPRQRRIRSAKDLSSLHPLWAGCRAAGLIEIAGQTAQTGAGLAVWQSSADPAAQVESWCALLSGYLQACDETARAGGRGASLRAELLPMGIPMLYAMAKEPLPEGLLVLAMVDLDDIGGGFGSPLLLQLPGLFAELGRLVQDWLVVGVLEEVALPRDEADELAVRMAELQAGVSEMLDAAGVSPGGSGAGSEEEPAVAALAGVTQALSGGRTVRLTPLGRYGLARMLSAHGWRVPQAGECLDVRPEDLLDRLSGYAPADVEAETQRWVQARGEAWQPAVERVLRSASVKGPEGPARRDLLPMVLTVAGPQAAPLLDAAAGDPWLAPVVALARHQQGLGPEPSVAQWLWLIVDELSPLLDDPQEFADEVADSPLADMLARPSGIADAVGLDHPQAREVLRAAAPHLDEPELARALRKALAGRSGHPARRSGARPPTGRGTARRSGGGHKGGGR